MVCNNYYLGLAFRKFMKNGFDSFDDAYSVLYSYKYFRECSSDILEYAVDYLMDYDSSEMQ